MSRSLTWLTTRKPLRALLGGFLALLWLAVSLLAADGPLHQALHHGGGKSSNHCAACLLAKGLVDVADSSAHVQSFGWFAHERFTARAAIFREQPCFLLPPGRAPPQSSAVS